MRTCTVMTAALGTWLAVWGTSPARGGTIDPLETPAPSLCSPGEATFASPSYDLLGEQRAHPSGGASATGRDEAGRNDAGLTDLTARAGPLPDPEPEGTLIPEPGSAMLLLAGLAALTVGRRRRG